MLGLPKATETSKQLPKKLIYTKFNMNTAQKEKFDAEISRIAIVNEVNPTTSRIKAGEQVGSFFVLSVLLKQKNFDEKIIIQLSKLIPQNILFVLIYESECKLAIYHTKLMQSEWGSIEEQSISLDGMTLDAVWQNIIVKVGDVNLEKGHSLDTQLAIDDKRKKIQREIYRIDSLARKEKQPKKKFEYAEQVKLLKAQLDELEVAPEKFITTAKKDEPKKATVEENVPSTTTGGTVKALSVLAPYAMDIFDGLKTVEWRSWKTDYRGDLLICSSSRKFEGCISGHALCMVELIDVVPFTKKHLDKALMDEVPDPAGYAWIIGNVRQIVPFALKGKLHIYDVDASMVEVLSPINTPESKEEYERYYKPLMIAAGGY